MNDPWIQNRDWAGVDGLVHGMLVRQPEVTEGKLAMSESLARAEQWFRKLVGDAGGDFDQLRIIGADQVHDDKIGIVNSDDQPRDAVELPRRSDSMPSACEFPETDGLIALQQKTLLVIQTADCLPILYFDSESEMIGACHCGWKGLYAKLGAKTTREMIDAGARAENLRAWIGPGVGVKNYEVGAELVGKFLAQFPGAEVSPNGTHLDLVAVARHQLEEAGIPPQNVTDSGLCTYEHANLFHSYRRDGPKAGRLLTVIARI